MARKTTVRPMISAMFMKNPSAELPIVSLNSAMFRTVAGLILLKIGKYLSNNPGSCDIISPLKKTDIMIRDVALLPLWCTSPLKHRPQGLSPSVHCQYSMFPFFLVGYYYQPKKLEKRHTGLKIAAGLILLVCGLILYFHGRELARFLKVMYGSKSYQALNLSMSEGVLFRSAWFCAAFLMTAALLYVVPDRRCRFTYIGERTLGVYLLHRLPRDLIKNLGLSRLIGGSSRALLFYVILSAAIILICSVKPADDACRRMFHLDCIMKRTPPAPEPAEPGK